jgi:hypothetical protein
MRFWIREFAGWVLMVLSLYVFYYVFRLLTDPRRYVEGGALTLIGIVIFRGGIHLLKIATAARICLEAETQMKEPARAPSSGAGRRIRSPLSSTGKGLSPRFDMGSSPPRESQQ